jgi:agmatine deiminase
MLSRRTMLGLTLGLCAHPLTSAAAQLTRQQWRIPAEQSKHARCWMAWPARTEVWGKNLNAVRTVCARAAHAVAQFEPVTMVARPQDVGEALHECGHQVTVAEMPVDDCWMRDTGPLIAVDQHHNFEGCGLNFNGWGNKQSHAADAQIAGRVCESLKMPLHKMPFVSEGGAWEFDGEGTALTTESAVLNPNRNPGLTKNDVESAARRWFGVDKIIWLPGAGDYWTDGHIDGIARFVRPGEVLIETTSDPHDPDVPWLPRDAAALKSATDARGRKLRVFTMERPRYVRSTSPEFCNCYVNFYVANGGVVMARFGDDLMDARARNLVASLFPDRRVVQVDIDALAAGGGGIHCITLQQPV